MDRKHYSQGKKSFLIKFSIRDISLRRRSVFISRYSTNGERSCSLLNEKRTNKFVFNIVNGVAPVYTVVRNVQHIAACSMC